MPISIKNAATEQLARRVADMTGESITDAIGVALSERYTRLQQARQGRSLAEELLEIGLRCSQLPKVSHLSDDEILGFDEFGVPTQ
jgi:antitoxin VapB